MLPGAKYLILAGSAAGAVAISVPVITSDNDDAQVVERSIDNYEVCLVSPLPTFEGASTGCYDKREVIELIDLPVLDRTSKPVSVELAHPTDYQADLVSCGTCRDYNEMTWRGWYAATSKDMRREAYFIRACGMALMLADAQRPDASFFGENGVNEDLLSGLSIGALPAFAADKAEEFERFQIREAEEGVWSISVDDQGWRLTEIAYADFNEDGVEDLLVFISSGEDGASAKIYDYGLLERRAPDESLVYSSRYLASQT